MGIIKKHVLILVGAGSLLTGSVTARAAFDLNFQPHAAPDNSSDVRRYARCNMAGLSDAFCQRADSVADPDKTPFLREFVTIDGVQYVHMIVGSLTPDATGSVFAQETYIKTTGTGSLYSLSGGKPGCDAQPAQCGGGLITWSSGNGQVASNASLGTPLAGDQHTTGIGTGDPARTVIRQAMKASGMEQEFLKADLLLKPKITQSILSSDGLMSSQFALDMSAINYSTNASGTMVNKLTLNDTDIPVESRFFDAVASAQSGNITGGRFTFAAGAGWVDNIVRSSYFTPGLNGAPPTLVPEDNIWVYDAGSYTYSNDSANITNIDWQAFRNPLENP